MDSPSNRSMFDTFKDKIWDELGPLDPNWFDDLTQAFTEDWNGTEEDTCNTANQDVIFKTPFEKGALDSQLSSTPKIFRHSREESPKTEDEELFSPERDKQMLPWTDTSPCLFGTSKGGVSITKPYRDIHPQDSFELLATPHKSTATFAQRISESLGAQINPDLSWTSSLNTPPPAMSPTIILPKTEDRTGPMSLTAHEHVVFVRKLFPSLSNISEVAVKSLKKSNEPTVQRAEDGREPDPIRTSLDDSPESSLEQRESDWRQTLPDAIENGEIRDTVAGVLKGAENVLSIFFSNSSSALRRVKTKDRIKRKQSISTEEHGCTSLGLSKITCEQTADDEKLKVPSSPHTGSKTKTEDIEITQWTPMSLSDISQCTMATTKQWEPNPVTEQKESEPDPSALVEPSFKSSIDSTVFRKTKTFVYSVQSVNPQVQGKDISLPTKKLDSSPGNQMSGQELNVKLGENAPDEPQCYISNNTCDVGNWLQKRGDFTQQNQVSSVLTKGQDLRVSQLCRAFAQDLTQMPESNKPGRMNEHSSQKGFSASACLSALKQRNKRLLVEQEASQRGATHRHDCTGISSGGHNSASHLKNSKTESTMNDSGFQSTVLDITPMTGSSLILPSSEKAAQTQPCPSFKTGINTTMPFPLLTVEKEKAQLDNIMEGTATHAISSLNLAKQRQKFDPGTDSKSYIENTFTRPPDGAKRALDMSMSVEQHGKVLTCAPKRVTVSPPSAHASGFRTASNRGIKISAVNLERAMGLFKEIEDESPKCGRNTEGEIGITCQSLGTNVTNSTHPPSSTEKCDDIQSQLTASQRADVTELCSLLEDADTQFEFTQFKSAKSHLHSEDVVPSHQRADKELDPDFLTGIDFDDSFSSDAEKHLAKTPDKTNAIHVKKSYKAPITKSKSTCASFYRTDKENAPTGDAPPISKHTSESIPGIEYATLGADKSDTDRDTGADKSDMDRDTEKPENKRPLMFDVGFKNAGGNAMRVSNKFLSKARALFADSENPGVISDTADSSDIGLANWDQAQTSSDKHRGVTDLTTRHQDSVEVNTFQNSDLLYIEEDTDSLSTGNHDLNNGEKIQGASSNLMESHCSKNRQIPDIQSGEHICKVNEHENGKINLTPSHGQKSGFQMASGKGITVSAKAVQETKALFKDCDVIESNDSASANHGKWTIVPEIGSDSYKENNSSFKTAQGMRVNTSGKPVNGCIDLENVNVGPVANHTMTPHHFDEQINNVHFKKPVTNAVSRSAKTSLIEKPLSSSLSTASTNVGTHGAMSTHGAFGTASGKKISVSDCALTKAKSVLHDCDMFEDKKQKTDTVRTSHPTNLNRVPPLRNGGFQTASGKGVAVSTTALKKAKALLNECDGFEDKKENTKTKVDMRASRPITPIHHPPLKNGFSTASGKGIALSTEALQKAKALLNDSNSNEEIPALSETKTTDYAHDNPEKIKCAFTTAGGIKVNVSEKSLLKARTFLNESADEESADALITPRSCLNSSFETSCIGDLKSFNGEGFQTASGKGVAVSTTALRKAKALLNECDGFEDEKENTKIKVGMRTSSPITPIHHQPPKNGFSTASGKGIAVSTEALQKAKVVLHDNNCNEEIPAVLETETTDYAHDNPEKIKCAFTTAGGLKVHVSEKSLLKVRTLLNESADEESADALITPRSCLKSSFETSCIGDLNSFNGQGFQTASGKGVAVSTTALRKAKALLNECDGFEDKKENATTKVSMRTSRPIAPIHHPPPKNGFSSASGKGIAVSTEALQKAKALLNDSNSNEEIPALSETKITDHAHDNPEKIKCAFTTAGGLKVHVSEKSLLKVRTLLNESADEESADALITPRSCLKSSFETSCIGDLNSFNGQGFQTASGKGVAVSTTALRKAKALLNECDGFEDKKENATTKVSMRTSRPIAPIHHPPPKNGFSSASGKGIAVSTEALQKAKALLNDSNSNEEIPALSETKMTDHAHDNPEKIKCAFTTAGGIKVNVSEKSLLKVRTLLNESADEKHGESIITPRSFPTSSFETSKSCIGDLNSFNGEVVSISRNTSDLKEVHVQEITLQEVISFRNPGVSCFTTSSGKGMSVSENAQKAQALKFKEDEIALSKENLHERPEEKKLLNASASFTPEQLAPVKVRGLEHCGVTQTTGKVTHQPSRTKGSSTLNFESLDLSGCTVTQQRYFAQEAMDCTKALLEDEDLADQSLAMTFGRLSKQDSPVCSKGSVETGAGKRSIEDTDMTEQPPLKRRLLDEFDRIVNGPRHSILRPAKSCSDGLTKDRRVFKYNVSLHPNITRPYRGEKAVVDPRLQKAEPQPATLSTLGDGKPSNSKTAVFILPFQKIVKTETLKSNVPQVKSRTPVFVPPFRRTTAKESLSKPPNKEDKLQHLCGMPSKTDTFVPPPKKAQSPAKATDTEHKEDIQTLDSQNVKTDNGDISCRNLRIYHYHGTEDSTAQGSTAEDLLSGSQDMVQNLQSLQLARDMQDMRTRKKKRQTIRPLPGSLFLAKTSGVDRVSLRDAVDGRYPVQHTQKRLYGYGVHQHVSEINGENAESFRFNCQQFFKKEAFIDGGGVQLADGGWLIPRNDGTTGKEEFYRALCDTPGVDPKLISEAWVYNHYRWIVWKQACTERSFPAKMAGLRLTPEQVLLQLKYRYDVEVDHCQRPALRKIMEKDDTAAKTLVLCVCGVVSRGHDPTRQSRGDIKTPQGSDSKAEFPVGIVWLTDGWYAIKAQMDVPLTAMLHRGRLAIGGKLIIHGAELVGSQDACTPLEAPESLMLKICANSSRPARWDTKLGFRRDPRPFLLPASSLYSNGGPVGCVNIVVLRSYPVQWMEKKPDGGFVFRCSRAEDKEARCHDHNKQKAMEIVFAKIQAQFEKEENDNNKPRSRRRTLCRQDIESLQDGEELHEAVENDPGYLEARLSEEQLGTLNSYRRSLGEKRQAELQERYHRALDNTLEGEGNCPKREVTPVWKLCIADSRDQPGSNVYLLNMWRPSMDLQSLLKEGGRYRAYNLTTSEGKKRAGTATVQFTATKKTQFQEIQASQEWLSVHFQPRISANFVDLQNPEFFSQCGEVDLVGYVISIIDGQGSSPVLYLVDGRMNFAKVRRFSSLAQSGLEDLVKPLALLAVSNLQLRPQSSTPVPVLYAGDLAFISTNPKEAHLQEAFTQLKNLGKEYLKSAEERLSHLIQSGGLNTISSPALQPRTPGCKTDARQDSRTYMTTHQPVRGFGSFTPLTRNPPSANSSADKDPRSLKRKRGLDFLSHIPSPPPVCPLGTMASPCVNRTFNPPRRSGTPSTLKPVLQPLEDEWVNDEELAMIDTQALHSRPG